MNGTNWTPARAAGALITLALGASTLAGCGDAEPRTIERKRTAQQASPRVIEGVTLAQRFGWRPSEDEASRARQEREERPSTPVFAFGLPEGWERLPETQFRQINTRVAAHPEAECYLTWLPMDGGGDVANVNRWRGQLGLGPVGAAEVAAMPRGTLLGAPAIRVDLAGSFVGMGGERVDDARLLGVLLTRREGGALFVKFVGPADVIAANAQPFDDFVASISLSDTAAPAVESPLTWQIPAGWEREPGSRPMREVTLTAGASELYVSILGGGGGGLLANVNRWLGQVGAAPLDVAGLEALERASCLGTDAYIVDAEGTLSAMGGPAREGMRLLGAVIEQPTRLVTVKLVGPAAEVEGQLADFLAFVASLEDRL